MRQGTDALQPLNASGRHEHDRKRVQRAVLLPLLLLLLQQGIESLNKFEGAHKNERAT